VDIIIGCSHQRSDTLQAIELINKFLAYHTNAYVIRSSVCMEVDGNIGGGASPWQIVDRAIEIGCQKVQLFKPYFDQAMVDKAHEHGIRCNVFYADDPEEAKQYLDWGIDTTLTNNYRVIAETVRGCKK